MPNVTKLKKVSGIAFGISTGAGTPGSIASLPYTYIEKYNPTNQKIMLIKQNGS